PEVQPGELVERVVKRPQTVVRCENVEATLTTLRKQRAKFNRAARGAREGDLVNVDFEGLIAGVPFEGNEASNLAFVVGEHRMLPDFEAAVVGLKEGEQKTFPITFPQDYAEALRGKTADFTVTMNQVA